MTRDSIAGLLCFAGWLAATSAAAVTRSGSPAAGPAAGISRGFARVAPSDFGAGLRTEDSSLAAERTAAQELPILAGFVSLSDTGVSPADPVVAAGPDHVVVAVNSQWAIYTKSGTQLFRASAISWFRAALSAVHAQVSLLYDPQILYDQFRGRWILVYTASNLASESWVLLSVSSSSDPNAPWFSWALRGDVNGTTPVDNFSDLATVGYDDTAIYVTANQFRYSDQAFQYAKIRVLKKDALYAGAAPAAWSDFWDLQDPDAPGTRINSVRPVDTFGSPGVGYLVSNSPYVTRSFATVWTVAGAATAAPTLSAVNVPLAPTVAPPRANQKGGSPGTAGCPTPCLLNTGAGRFTAAVYRNGSIWVAHTVADESRVYSRARYARIRVSASRAIEDESYGSDGCWLFYPALAVDDGNDMAMVFGRSCADEYAGLALTGRSTADAALRPRVVLKDGAGSYVVPVGESQQVNRWGDYFGAALDPADAGRIWVVGQYASATNRWGTWVGETLVTLSAGDCRPDSTTLCLGDGRFRLRVDWSAPDGASGHGAAVPITGDTGDFWFFDEQNIELVVKVLDGCGVNQRYWVFAGGLTNVDVTLAVTDTATGRVASYANRGGTPFAPVQDTSAFATCP